MKFFILYYKAEHNHNPIISSHCKSLQWNALGFRPGWIDKAWAPNWWGFFVLFCAQVGYIQLGSEQLLIQPVNASESSFSGKEHFIRRRRSPKPGHPPRPQGPEEHCKVVAGEWLQRAAWQFCLCFVILDVGQLGLGRDGKCDLGVTSQPWGCQGMCCNIGLVRW